MISKTLYMTLVFAFCDGLASTYLDVEKNFFKPKMERNNKINRGLWLKNKYKDASFEKPYKGDFIFRANSLDADHISHPSFDEFGQSTLQFDPFVSRFIERSKRSPNQTHSSQSYQIGEKKCTSQTNCIEPSLIKSKIISRLKPTTIFNEYPYEIAVLLNNDFSSQELQENSSKIFGSHEILNDSDLKIVPLTNSNQFSDIYQVENNKNLKQLEADFINKKISDNISPPKRSMKSNLESDIIKKLELTERLNRTNELEPNLVNREIFDAGDNIWHQTAPVPEVNAYQYLSNVLPLPTSPPSPMDRPKHIKTINERGLIKIVSMLTKTFKKVMKQHDDIKKIHEKFNTISKEFAKSVEYMGNKFQAFDKKYQNIVEYNDKIARLETKLAEKEEYFLKKEKELARNLLEFENQQKKFLSQQKQFYNIQKLMLSQNEKVNARQSSIAKAQSEISQRQNSFARILKKAKQLYNENILSKHKTDNNKSRITQAQKIAETGTKMVVPMLTTTKSPESSDTVKINLFSIPVLERLRNQDDLILKEKDSYAVDDLVYKFYFNNTFIDNLMKTGFLASIVSENEENTRNTKNKRASEDLNIKNTILLPVNTLTSADTEIEVKSNSLQRSRRWINHQSKHLLRKNAHKKSEPLLLKENNKAHDTNKTVTNNKQTIHNGDSFLNDKKKPIVEPTLQDPFTEMANNFCKLLGQDMNKQMMRWCIEKALRKLHNIDLRLPSLNPIKPLKRKKYINTTTRKPSPLLTSTVASITKILSTEPSPLTVPSDNATVTTQQETEPTPIAESTADVQSQQTFFPDNEELESNLKQYELKPDPEGNIYYDGSLHASDLVRFDDEGASDIMPGMDSNSHIELDPLALEVQAQRRAQVRNFNDRLLKRLARGDATKPENM